MKKQEEKLVKKYQKQKKSKWVLKFARSSPVGRKIVFVGGWKGQVLVSLLGVSMVTLKVIRTFCKSKGLDDVNTCKLCIIKSYWCLWSLMQIKMWNCGEISSCCLYWLIWCNCWKHFFRNWIGIEFSIKLWHRKIQFILG